MKKVFENIYIFSKFSVILVLFICLIGTLYIFYKNYEKEKSISQKQLNIEENLKESINKNSILIEKIANELKFNNSKLLDIKKNLETLSAQNKTENTSSLENSINILNKNFNKLSKELKDLKSKNSLLIQKSKNNSIIIDTSKEEIIDLIVLKYENQMNIQNEINYLIKIIEKNKQPIINKISILSTKPFKGYKYLSNVFDEEVNIYLKKTINKNQDSLFNKIVLPYLDISPTTENPITNDIILKIKNIKSNIESNDIENAEKNLKSILDSNNIFKTTLFEIDKYLKFKNELHKLK